MNTSSLSNRTVLIISPESWGINFVSKHHYAINLARRGNLVYFINPPSSKTDLNKVEDNLYYIDYKPMIRGVNRLPPRIRDWVVSKDIKRIIKFIKVQEVDLIWSFDPYRFQNLNLFGGSQKIYHPVDIHNTRLEKEIAVSADLILASSDQILGRFNWLNKPKYKISHGLSEQFLKFDPNETMINFIADSNRTKVGYMGNLNYKLLDIKTLTEIVKSFPNIDFYFIGPYCENNLSAKHNNGLVSFLQNQSNCYLLGSKQSQHLPQYLNQMDLFLMCYRGDNHIAHLANPHKILEYLSTGKVIVSHYIDEYKDKRRLLEMVDNNIDLISSFKEVVGNLLHYNSKEKSEMRKEFAKSNTYVAQIDRISNILGSIA